MSTKITDIAEHAGLSKAVVSSVLGGGSSNVRYSERTRKRVLETAAKLNYKIRRTHGIGLIHCSGKKTTPSNWVEWISPMLTALHHEALVNEQLLSLFSYSATELDQALTDNNLPQILKRRKIDGLVVSGALDKELINYIHGIHLPYVLMNVSESDVHAENSVCFDEIFTGTQATNYLIEHGYRNIMHLSVNWSSTHYSVPMRQSGYEYVMHKHDLSPRVVQYTQNDDPQCVQRLRDILLSKDRPDAIFAYNEQTALFCTKMLYDLKLGFDDVAIIGVAWQDVKSLDIMGITSVELPAAEMGKQAFQKLIYKIEDNQPMPTISLRGNIKESQSVPGRK